MIAGTYIGYHLKRFFLYYTSTGLLVLLVFMFLIVSFFLAIQMQKIKYKNFKDKSILFLLVYVVIIWSVATAIILVLLKTNINYQAVITVWIVSALTSATASQLILFTTKLLPVVCEKLFPDEAQTTIPWQMLHYQQQQLSQQRILNTSPKQFHFKTL